MLVRSVSCALMLLIALPSVSLARELKILTQADIDPSKLLPPPDADGSPGQKAELASLLELARTRTEERYEQSKWDDEHEDPSIFEATTEQGFALKSLPATAALLSNHALGVAVATLLLHHPAMQEKIEAARKELRAARVTG